MTTDEPEFRCRCGALRSTTAIMSFGSHEPIGHDPSELLEPCTCPRCAHCERTLDEGDACQTMDCPLYGIQVPMPPQPS